MLTGGFKQCIVYIGVREITNCTNWDEAGDDDYLSDPDGKFYFQAFCGPIEVVAGQVRQHNL